MGSGRRRIYRIYQSTSCNFLAIGPREKVDSSIDKLEKMLASLYTDMSVFPEFKTVKEHTGKLMVAQ